MRHLRVVASVALIASLALVAVPDAARSRTPSSFDPPDPALFRQVEVAAAVHGTSMTTEPLDPGDRAGGILDDGSILFEPMQRSEPTQVRPLVAQPQAKAVAVSRNPWHLDRNVSWYGPGLYGNGTACGLKLTKGLVGVAHRTLPCGTRIQFRNPDTGTVVTAEVIDRGPYVSGRQWDLSHGLCAKLAHCFTGSIQWRYAPGS